MNKRLLVSAAAGAATIATLAPAVAQAGPPGTCQFTAHLQLANGSYSTDLGGVECSGVIAGQPVHGGGFLQAWGDYSADNCRLTWRDNVLYARIPEMIEFFGPTYIDSIAGYELTGTETAMQLRGSGDNDGQPFTETGIARFTPDQSASTCVPQSGTLSETVAIVDGGGGNVAADDAVNRNEGASYVAGDGSVPNGQSSAAPATVSHHSSIRSKHRTHRKHARKAHRTARRQRR
jgi:hypothetical protein